MAHLHPLHPYFTVCVCERGILREPYRLVDVGVRGGLQDHWRFLGDYLEAWGFDPLFEEGVGPLIAANPHPERIRFFNYGLGDEDTEREFRFLPDNPSSSFFAASNGSDPVDASWRKLPIRRLDTLLSDGTIGLVDFMKLDAESYEVEIIKGAQMFFNKSGIIGIESEVNFFRTPRHPRSQFVTLYDELAPYKFVLYDAGPHRVPRAPLANGFPKDLDVGSYANRPIGRADVFDVLFLGEIFDNRELQREASIDKLLKLICTAELYGLQDVGLDVLFANAASLAGRLDVEEAANWLIRERPTTRLTYQKYRRDSANWTPGKPREPTIVCYEGAGETMSIIPLERNGATDVHGVPIMRVSHPVDANCRYLRFHMSINLSATQENIAVITVCQDGKSSPVAVLTQPVNQREISILDQKFCIPIEPHSSAPIFNIRVGLAGVGGNLLLNRDVAGDLGGSPVSYVWICED